MDILNGFPRGTRYTPIPSPLLGPLMAKIRGIIEFKFTLRFVWMLHQQRGQNRFITLERLLQDRILQEAFHEFGDSVSIIKQGLMEAVDRGTILSMSVQENGKPTHLYFLNTPTDRAFMTAIQTGQVELSGFRSLQTEGVASNPRPNIFSLYEENIGIITPLLAEELMEATNTYPDTWIIDAFREAVRNNKRHWRYISRILERWISEGKSNGEPRRYSEKVDLKEFLRRQGRLSRG